MRPERDAPSLNRMVDRDPLCIGALAAVGSAVDQLASALMLPDEGATPARPSPPSPSPSHPDPTAGTTAIKTIKVDRDDQMRCLLAVPSTTCTDPID